MNRLLQTSFLILSFFSSSILFSQEDEQQDFSNERKLSAGMSFGNGFVNSNDAMHYLYSPRFEISYRFRISGIKGPFHVLSGYGVFSTGYPLEIDGKEYNFSSSISSVPLRLRWGPEVEGNIEPFLQAGTYYAHASEEDHDIYISQDGLIQEEISVDEFQSFGHILGLGFRYYNPNQRVSVVATFEKIVDYEEAVPEYSIDFSRYLMSVSFRYNIL